MHIKASGPLKMTRVEKRREGLLQELEQLRRRVAELEASDRERRRLQEELLLLQTLIQSVSTSADMHTALDLAIQKVCRATGWVYGEAWVPNPKGEYLELSPAWYGSTPALNRFRRLSEGFIFPPRIGLPGRTWSLKRAVWIPDVTVERWFLRYESARKAGLRAGVGVPILAGEEVISVLVFFLFKACEKDEDFVKLVSAVASQLGAVFHRKRAEEALRESEERFRALFESALDPIFIKDASLRYTAVNPAMERLLGLPCSALSGMTDGEVFGEEAGRETRKEDLRVLAGEIIEGEHSRTVKGRKATFHVVKVPIYNNNGEVMGLCGVIHDITERKRTEETLRNIAEGVSAETGEAFFRSLVLYLAGALEMDYAFVAELEEDGGEIARTIALCARGRIVENIKYRLAGTPCDNVRKKQLCCYPSGIRRLFPEDRMLSDMEIESYIGTPLFGSTGRVLGLIVVMGTNPLGNPRLAASMLQIFAVRASAELERKRFEEELMASREQLRNLSLHLQSVREEERAHLSREIHDELGQALTALKMDLAWLKKRLPGDQQALFEKLVSAEELTRSTLQAVKRISAELRPGLLDDVGLTAAIEWQAEEFRKRTGIECRTRVEQDLGLEKDLSTTIFRIVQEALTNVARHARAGRVEISLRERDGVVRLLIIDDGVGITAEQASDPRSFGLLGIRERVRFWNGRVKVKGSPGKGTTLDVVIPLRREGRG